MSGVEDRQPAGEQTSVPSGWLAHVQDGRGDLAWGDTDLDTPPGEYRVQRVVVAVDPDQRLLGDPRHPAAIRLERHLAERPQLPLMRQPLGRDTTDRAMHPTVHLLSPAVELLLKVQVVRERPTRLKVRPKEPMLTLQLSFRLSIPSIKDDPADLQLAAKGQERLARLPAPGDR